MKKESEISSFGSVLTHFGNYLILLEVGKSEAGNDAMSQLDMSKEIRSLIGVDKSFYAW